MYSRTLYFAIGWETVAVFFTKDAKNNNIKRSTISQVIGLISSDIQIILSREKWL